MGGRGLEAGRSNTEHTKELQLQNVKISLITRNDVLISSHFYLESPRM